MFHRAVAERLRKRAVAEVTPDIIVASMPTPETCKAMLDYAEPRRIPVLIDVRDVWPDAFLTRLPAVGQAICRLGAPWFARDNRAIFHRATGVIGVSKTYLNWGIAHAGRPAGRFDGLFPLGFRPRMLSDDSKTKNEAQLRHWGLRSDAFTCCFFGGMGSSADLETVINAARRLPDVGFVLCGDGPNLHSLRATAKGLPNVVFPGWVGPEVMSSLMEWSSVGLAPYAQDAQQSLPNKPFQYFSAGLPVLSSLPGELEELLRVRACGVSVPPGSFDALVAEIRHMQADESLRQQMGRTARPLRL